MIKKITIIDISFAEDPVTNTPEVYNIFLYFEL